MIQPSFRTLLVPAIGITPLLQPALVPTDEAAIALAAVAMRADDEHQVTSTAQTNPLPENHFAGDRHMSSPAGLDNGSGFVAP